eukprot:SAG25_NODE_46_length_19040_cov_20.665699_20_plen_147_part_00
MPAVCALPLDGRGEVPARVGPSDMCAWALHPLSVWPVPYKNTHARALQPGDRCTCVASAAVDVHAEFELDSEVVGELGIGKTIEVLEVCHAPVSQLTVPPQHVPPEHGASAHLVTRALQLRCTCCPCDRRCRCRPGGDRAGACDRR